MVNFLLIIDFNNDNDLFLYKRLVLFVKGKNLNLFEEVEILLIYNKNNGGLRKDF